jgi:hypothetical protein
LQNKKYAKPNKPPNFYRKKRKTGQSHFICSKFTSAQAESGTEQFKERKAVILSFFKH